MSLNTELLEIIKSVKRFIELQMESGLNEYLAEEKAPAKTAALESLEQEALSCQRCGLYRERTNVVFGTGTPDARLMFIGEGPGYDEDKEGLPFVGRAGQLLTKIIEAMGLKRKDVYITNVVKCRPPQNRTPLPTEILACAEYLTKQIDIIKPKIICALGKVPTHALLKTEEPITKMRGHFCAYKDIKLMPTFHPAYLLRNPDDKKLVWHDVKKIMAQLK